MNSNRYGVRWPNGTETGAITDKQRLAAHYAKHPGGNCPPGIPIDYKTGEEAKPLPAEGEGA